MNEKKLGFGLMRLPMTEGPQGSCIDIEKVKEMVDAFLEKGFNYFDTAWMYCGFKSEDAAKEALVDRHPRDSFTLADKLHAEFIRTKEDRDYILHEQMRKTGVDFFDYYLIHDVGAHHYEIYKELECFEWLRGLKESGKAKKIGFSFHDSAELLDKVLTEQPGMDFVQLQMNYLDWENEGVQSRKCYEVAVKHGLPVFVMEPVKGGTLANVPPEAEEMFKAHRPDMSVASWAIRFVAGLDNVKMVLSGMSTMEQLQDNMAFMTDFEPLNDSEQEIVKKVTDIINGNIAVPCTACAYCVDGCPMNIPIPKYFSLYNADMQEDKSKDWTPQWGYYNNLKKDFGSAASCVGCGQCERVCPQHLPIIRHLQEVAAHFE